MSQAVPAHVRPLVRRASIHRRVLQVAAAAILVLNLLDALFTIAYTRSGLASEGNPLMDRALDGGPVSFMIVKLSLVSLGVLLLWRLRARRSAAFALVGSAVAYSSLLVYHLSAAHQLVALAQ